METVLFIDCYNNFLRTFSAFPSMTIHGQQSGGIVGFLKTIQGVCNDVKPTVIYAVWEGGGSRRRRNLYPDYKMQRRPQRLNRFYDFGDIPDTVENQQWQVLMLTKILSHLPIRQIYVEDIEADDAIAYLARYKHANDRKIFLSSDRDYYQLLDKKSLVYRPGRKKFVSYKDVLEEFGISVTNFALAKSVAGDDSDNIPGINGVGFKTLAKRIPILALDEDVTIDALLEAASEHSDKYAVLKRICESESLIRRNWQLVYLDMSMMAASQIKSIDTLSEAINHPRKIDLMRLLMKEGITEINVDNLLMSMITAVSIKSE